MFCVCVCKMSVVVCVVYMIQNVFALCLCVMLWHLWYLVCIVRTIYCVCVWSLISSVRGVMLVSMVLYIVCTCVGYMQAQCLCPGPSTSSFLGWPGLLFQKQAGLPSRLQRVPFPARAPEVSVLWLLPPTTSLDSSMGRSVKSEMDQLILSSHLKAAS